MAKNERKKANNRNSLEAKTFRTTLIASIILGLALLIVGLGLYSYSLASQYVKEAFYISQSAAVSSLKGADTVQLSKTVMERYRSLSEQERQKLGTAEYRDVFTDAEASQTYETLMNMLPSFASSGDVSVIYIAMYDRDTSSLVYIVDSDEFEPYHPGYYESVHKKELDRFLNWNGSGMLYDFENTEEYGWICTAGTPIRDESGEVCSFLLVDVTVNNLLRGMRSYAFQITSSLIVVMSLVTWLLTRRIKKTLVSPINRIADAAQDYVRDRLEGRSNTTHFANLGINTGDEVENLGSIMADMEREMSEYEADLTRVTAEKERINTELSLATRIQASMLPSIFPPFPERSEFDLYASMDPAKEVGGDFYDYFLIDDDHLYVAIADVSGKGVPAALFMMASKIILANNAMTGKSPAQILRDTNAAICSNNRAEMFVTVWLGILEISTGRLIAANAGHEYPALRKKDGAFEIIKDKHGFVIGGMDGVKYTEYELMLEPGSKLFVYTDGVAEAMDPDKALFGTDRMLGALNEAEDGAPEQVLKTVRSAVDGFVRGAEQFDDITMLCLEYRGR